MNLKKFITQKGLSLTEALVAVVVSTIVMGATYTIYNNFQGTFIRQINHNNMKQEARFALHMLQFDSKMAGYKHPDSTLGEVQEPVKVLNDDADETEVSDDTEYGEKVLFCFDTEENDGTIRRKLIKYELKIPYSPETEKTVLKKKIWNTTNCDESDSNTTVDVDWMPVAQFFEEFKIRLRSKHIDFEVELESVDEKVSETYTASAYMRNLNFGGSTFYVYDEEDLHENRTPVIQFTGSLKAQCANNLTRDIQLSNFVTNDDVIILHQGEKVGTTALNRTYDDIIFRSEKPPEVTGIPDITHSEMRLKLVTVSTDTTIPPGLSVTSGYDDLDNDNVADDGEWNGTLKISGDLTKTDTGYSFNSDGYQDFNIRVKADLDTNCDGEGWVDQNEAYKDYTIRVMKFEAPQFSDINLHTWEPKGFTYGKANYESRGSSSYNGGPNYDLTDDGRSFYIQQNLASPSFLVSTDQYDSFVLKGMICSGGYPDCNPQMNAWMDDDMLGFAAGYQRPSVVQKKWPDGKIRACAGIDYERLSGDSNFDATKLKNSLRGIDKAEWDSLSASDKNSWWGEPADLTYDMYLWSWWGARGNQSAIHLHHFKGYEFSHTRNCGRSEGSYLSHANMSHLTGWSTPSSSQQMNYNTKGYDRLFARFDNTRPANTGFRNCNSRGRSFSRISYNPGATHRWNCSWGRNTGVKNTITMTFHPNKFRANIENKPHLSNTLSQRFTAFDYRFDSDGTLHDHTSSTFPFSEVDDGVEVTLPGRSQDRDDLKKANFKRFQRGSVAIVSFSQPDNRYSNIQIARLPRYVPIKTADNKPMPKAQNLYYYMDEDYKTVNRIYGLLSKSYDPQGEHLEVLVDANSDSNSCDEIGTVAGDLAESATYKTQSVDGSDRTMDCRLSGTWRAVTAVWANNSELPNIGEMYDTRNKASYSGARATVTTTAGGKMHVYADGSFKYDTLPTGFDDGEAHEDSFYYAVQTEDTSNTRISDIKKVYIGFNIENTTPSGVSFKEEDGTAISDKTNFDMAEDANKDLVIGQIYVTTTGDDAQEPDDHDFVRFNLGEVPNDDSDKDVDHGTRFRIDQKDDKFYLVLNDDSDIRWANLPTNKKYFAVRIIATDLRGNQLATTEKVHVDRVDCSETAMENISVYKTKAAMTIEGYIYGKEGEKVFRRQTVPFTSNLDEAVITFDFPERSVQPSVKIAEKTVTVDGEDVTIGMLSNRCKTSHNYIDRQQLWSDS
ncbi:PilW family protein [Candidatus Pelagibacter communis]|uniref:PilW family protein n=1 Tax=Pelagibacter ubique TaxID=198252 RepID=UPI00094C4E4B|nr:hypothetical protein [Candidatus Pelagibacter ubique]